MTPTPRLVSLGMFCLWCVVLLGALGAHLHGRKKHDPVSRLGRVGRTSVVYLVTGSAQYLLFGMGLPFSWATLGGITLVSLLPASLLIAHIWRGRLEAVEATGLLVRSGAARRPIAWSEIEAVGLGPASPLLLVRTRGQQRALTASVPPALVGPLLAALRERIPLQRLEPTLWDDRARLWFAAKVTAAARAAPPGPAGSLP